MKTVKAVSQRWVSTLISVTGAKPRVSVCFRRADRDSG